MKFLLVLCLSFMTWPDSNDVTIHLLGGGQVSGELVESDSSGYLLLLPNGNRHHIAYDAVSKYVASSQSIKVARSGGSLIQNRDQPEAQGLAVSEETFEGFSLQEKFDAFSECKLEKIEKPDRGWLKEFHGDWHTFEFKSTLTYDEAKVSIEKLDMGGFGIYHDWQLGGCQSYLGRWYRDVNTEHLLAVSIASHRFENRKLGTRISFVFHPKKPIEKPDGG